ncbi:MAG: PhoH family protein [Alphaproteobacteria bacterium]|nr:MAG: PhoH family protein [Alphaproteobacteria bacterium]
MNRNNPTSTRSTKVRAQETKSIKIDNTRHLADICGSHDKHLAMIEQALDVYVMPRGNELCIEGSRRETRMAANVVEELIRRLDKGLPAGEAEVSAAIRMVLEGGEAGNTASTSLDQHQIRTQKKIISPRSPRQAAYIDALRHHDLVFGLGPAGTGKTYLAVAIGVSMLIRGEVDRLILSRPAVEAGERLGFLPGDMKDKVDPYLRPLYDALHDVMGGDQVHKKLENGDIEVAPLAFMRGRTLSNAFVILDEAQNCTRMQIKMFLTRLGENSRMVVTGDPTQVDLSEMGPHAREPGLGEALAILQGIEEVAIVHFTEADVVRHPLVQRIVRAYNERQNG